MGINASKACYDLNPVLKNKILKGAKIEIEIKVGEMIDSFYGYGSKNLTLLSKEDIVFRKSSYICDRTILINCSKSSIDLNRNFIKNFTSTKQKITIIFREIDAIE